jgi:hypothetical protein
VLLDPDAGAATMQPSPSLGVGTEASFSHEAGELVYSASAAAPITISASQ